MVPLLGAGQFTTPTVPSGSRFCFGVEAEAAQTVFPGMGPTGSSPRSPEVLQDEAVQHLGQALEDEARVRAVLAQ